MVALYTYSDLLIIDSHQRRTKQIWFAGIKHSSFCSLNIVCDLHKNLNKVNNSQSTNMSRLGWVNKNKKSNNIFSFWLEQANDRWLTGILFSYSVLISGLCLFLCRNFALHWHFHLHSILYGVSSKCPVQWPFNMLWLSFSSRHKYAIWKQQAQMEWSSLWLVLGKMPSRKIFEW